MQNNESAPKLDNSHAKIVAYIVVAGFFAIMLVFGMRSAGQAPLHEGDRRESVECKLCQGSGTTEGNRCNYCLGAKKVKVIIAGPNHPVRIRGTVWNLSAFDGKEQAEAKSKTADYSRVSLKANPQTVGRAILNFKKGEEVTEIQGKVNGRYRGFLEPGAYTLTIKSDGFKAFEKEVTIPKRQHPVWPEINGFQPEDEDQQTLEIFLTP